MPSSEPLMTDDTVEPAHQPPQPSAWPPEQAVFALLLDAHPRRLNTLALAGELRDRLEPADVERAIANLAEAGLVERSDETVEPAPRVLEFETRLD